MSDTAWKIEVLSVCQSTILYNKSLIKSHFRVCLLCFVSFYLITFAFSIKDKISHFKEIPNAVQRIFDGGPAVLNSVSASSTDFVCLSGFFLFFFCVLLAHFFHLLSVISAQTRMLNRLLICAYMIIENRFSESVKQTRKISACFTCTERLKNATSTM